MRDPETNETVKGYRVWEFEQRKMPPRSDAKTKKMGDLTRYYWVG